MTKQEEIQKWIKETILRAIKWAVEEGMTDGYLDMYADEFLKYLHSQGCVIKVDRELPTEKGVSLPFKVSPELSMPVQKQIVETAIKAYERAEQDVVEAGYVATVPLIKEGLDCEDNSRPVLD